MTGWTPPNPLPGAPRLSAATLAELLDGGQSFRWHASPDGTWTGAWAGNLARLQLTAEGTLVWSAPGPLAGRVREALPAYLFGHDAGAALDTLPWRSDPHLARCLAAFPGLTILRQPFGETLLCFLCSATKQIVQIKQMVALLADRHGSPFSTFSSRPARCLTGDKSGAGGGSGIGPAMPGRQLPSWERLAGATEDELRKCLLGFRARYIHQTALFLAAHPGWLDETEQLPYAEAKARLVSLPGVGAKVADCVLLFGAGRLEAFPVDTWIIKAMAHRYALAGWSPEQVAHFGRVHFGPHAGLAQQYLFAYERAQGRTPPAEDPRQPR